MKFELEITKIVLLVTRGTDKVCIHTNLPSPYPPSISSEPLMLDFDVTKGKGVDYIKKNFGVKPEVIDTRGTGS